MDLEKAGIWEMPVVLLSNCWNLINEHSKL